MISRWFTNRGSCEHQKSAKVLQSLCQVWFLTKSQSSQPGSSHDRHPEITKATVKTQVSIDLLGLMRPQEAARERDQTEKEGQRMSSGLGCL